jgi:hypothetical protein
MPNVEKPRFIVVGGGLAGMMTIIKIAEAGYEVDAFSFVPFRRSHSVCAQGGINGAVNTKATSSATSRPSRRCATPRPASSISSTAWASPSRAPPRG